MVHAALLQTRDSMLEEDVTMMVHKIMTFGDICKVEHILGA